MRQQQTDADERKEKLRQGAQSEVNDDASADSFSLKTTENQKSSANQCAANLKRRHQGIHAFTDPARPQ